jgi:hypothetical protein
MRETTFVKLLATKLKPLGHYSRIENIAGSGIPDIHFFSEAHGDNWVEVKIVKGNQIYFRTAQITWMGKRQACNGSVSIVARKDDYIYILPSVLILDKEMRENGKQSILNLKQFASLAGFCWKKPWDWDEIVKSMLQ